MDLSETTLVVALDRTIDASVEEGVVILQLQNGKYFGLGETGARIWDLLKTPRTLGEIEQVLLQEYSVEPSVCHREVARLVSDLIEEGLVVVREE